MCICMGTQYICGNKIFPICEVNSKNNTPQVKGTTKYAFNGVVTMTKGQFQLKQVGFKPNHVFDKNSFQEKKLFLEKL